MLVNEKGNSHLSGAGGSIFISEFFRYGLVGILSAAVHFLVGWYAMSFLSPVAGSLLGYPSGFVVSYLGNSLWTFGHRLTSPVYFSRQRLLRFGLVAVAGISYNTLAMLAFTEWQFFSPVSNLILIVISWPVIGFLLCRFVVFNTSDTFPHDRFKRQ